MRKNHLSATITIKMDLGKNHQQTPKGVGARVWWGTGDLHSLKVFSHKLLITQSANPWMRCPLRAFLCLWCSLCSGPSHHPVVLPALLCSSGGPCFRWPQVHTPSFRQWLGLGLRGSPVGWADSSHMTSSHKNAGVQAEGQLKTFHRLVIQALQR